MNHSVKVAAAPRRSWQPRSLALIVLAWLILQLGGLFSPGLLDDVDSVYIQIAREMLARHDFVTPTIDGIRFFDKPPLMYWLAAGSMHVFGIHDWAARLPLALGVLALFFAVYALGNRLYRAVSPQDQQDQSDRAGLYAALITATSLGIYLYTRFFIPDTLVILWMTLSVHFFLIARERALVKLAQNSAGPPMHKGVILSEAKDLGSSPDPAQMPGATHLAFELRERRMPVSPLLAALGFAAVLALSLLTKGFIGIVFPLAFAFLFLLLRRELRLLRWLCIPSATAAFVLIAAPWHILAALRNPAIPMPAGVGLPARAGWAWFYLYNEHIARFLSRRIPHDYGNVPRWLFWVLLAAWLFPWTAFLPAALRNAFLHLRKGLSSRTNDAVFVCILWAAIVLVFFTVSARQEYYHLPALPALALLVAGLLAAADRQHAHATRQVRQASAFFLVPLGVLLAVVCAYFAITAHTPPPGADLYSVLNNDPANYNLSLGHLFDLTGTAMGFFRGPLLTVAVGMLVLGPIQHLIRRRSRTHTANLAVVAGMAAVLLAAHTGLSRFYPILGSKQLALDIRQQLRPGDLVAIDGELTSGSTLLFYTGQPVLLVNGRINGPWFGSFWPDAPRVFLNDVSLHTLWSGPHRVFLLTYHPETRVPDLSPFGATKTLASAGGKTILTNR